MAGLGSWLPRRPVLGGDRTPQLMRRELVAWNLQDFALFIGLDVGKSEHHATALTTTGEKAYDKPPAQRRGQTPRPTGRSDCLAWACPVGGRSARDHRRTAGGCCPGG